MKNKTNNDVYRVFFVILFELSLSTMAIAYPIIFWPNDEQRKEKVLSISKQEAIHTYIHMTLHKLKLVQKLQIADQSKGSDMEEWFHEHLHIPEYQQLIIKHIFSKCLLKRDTGNH